MITLFSDTLGNHSKCQGISIEPRPNICNGSTN